MINKKNCFSCKHLDRINIHLPLEDPIFMEKYFKCKKNFFDIEFSKKNLENYYERCDQKEDISNNNIKSHIEGITHENIDEIKKIFINYVRENLDQARKLYENLKNYDVWFDKESLLPGQDWELEITKAIKSSDFMILLFSNVSINKRGVGQKEYKLALEILDAMPFGQIFVIPVRLEKCEIPEKFKKYHYVDLFPDWNKGLEKIIQSIKYKS